MDLPEELYIEIDPRSHLEVADSKHRYAKNLRYYFQEFARLMGTVGMSPHPTEAPTSSSYADESICERNTLAGDDSAPTRRRVEFSRVPSGGASCLQPPSSFSDTTAERPKVTSSVSVPCLSLGFPDETQMKTTPRRVDADGLLRTWKMLAAPSPRPDAVDQGPRLQVHSERVLELVSARRRSDSYYRRSKSAPPRDSGAREASDSPAGNAKSAGTGTGRHSLGASTERTGREGRSASVSRNQAVSALQQEDDAPVSSALSLVKPSAGTRDTVKPTDDSYAIGTPLGDADTDDLSPGAGTDACSGTGSCTATTVGGGTASAFAEDFATAEESSWKWDHFSAFFEWLDGDTLPEVRNITDRLATVLLYFFRSCHFPR
jgi:hypothetical protein